MIAQEVEEVVPEVVSEGELLDGTTAKRVDYAKLVGLLIEANKEQQDVIAQLEERIIDLEKQTIMALQTSGQIKMSEIANEQGVSLSNVSLGSMSDKVGLLNQMLYQSFTDTHHTPIVTITLTMVLTTILLVVK